ncbi:MAG TPA: nucleotide pyrophosphohydrolase [Syntrophorhabdales bacterium]|nr:nucleotide pyrophosphohydrolase [Syntrophorhabdales bacterium]
MDEIRVLTEKIKKFRDERDWLKFHNHKDMAISLVLEATELLEHFQWKSAAEVTSHAQAFKEEISEELADVAIYLLELADNLGINLSAAINEKLRKNQQKYPVEKARGKHTKYDKL